MDRENPEFTTDRLIARELTESDIPQMFHLHSNYEVMKYIHAIEKTIDETKLTYDRMLKYHDKKEGMGLWSVFLKDTGTYIGWVILKPLDNTSDIEIGYRFLPEFWGNGYATEISSRICRYGFQVLNLDKIVGITHPENISSQNVLKKLGLNFIKISRYYGVEVHFFEMGNPYLPKQSL
jgi:[ribosomal protein S5]-alanine N-acetyltransferase